MHAQKGARGCVSQGAAEILRIDHNVREASARRSSAAQHPAMPSVPEGAEELQGEMSLGEMGEAEAEQGGGEKGI